MYIKDIKEEREDGHFHCYPALGDWLIYEGHLPLFARTKKGFYVFVRTERFEEEISKAPRYMKVINRVKGGG